MVCKLCGLTYNEFHAYRPTGNHSHAPYFNLVCCADDDPWYYVAILNDGLYD